MLIDLFFDDFFVIYGKSRSKGFSFRIYDKKVTFSWILSAFRREIYCFGKKRCAWILMVLGILGV